MVAKRTLTGISPPVGVEFGATECRSQPTRSAFLAMPFIIAAMVVPAFALVPTLSLPALCANGLEFVPLVIREPLAEIKSHPDVRLFKFDAGLCDGVDLSKDFRLIRLGGFPSSKVSPLLQVHHNGFLVQISEFNEQCHIHERSTPDLHAFAGGQVVDHRQVESARLLAGNFVNQDDQQDNHQDADHCPNPRFSAQTVLDIMSSSLVRIMRIETRMAAGEITHSFAVFCFSSSSIPRNPSPSQIRARTVGAFSPIPRAKTRVSTPPNAAANAPIRAVWRYNDHRRQERRTE
jgi:hypothetical protein